jgi:pimeloyl-ACP methyl ester carboxylesterase
MARFHRLGRSVTKAFFLEIVNSRADAVALVKSRLISSQLRSFLSPFLTSILPGVLAILIAASISHAAAAEDRPNYPVVFVPGILGSKLCNTAGDVLWGKSARQSLSNFHVLDLTTSAPGSVKPCGIVDSIQVLGPFYSIAAYSNLLDTMMHDWKLVEGKDLFLFDYDWRQSNLDTAAAFERFVANKLGTDKKFNIVAHSMGGLVVRLYMERRQASSRVNKIVYLGTPFLGSMSTLGTLSEGWGTLPNWIAGGIDGIRRTALSFPSLMELLPRYRECCSFKKEGGHYVAIDVFDPEVWRANGWLPADIEQGAMFAHFSDRLKRASSITSVMTSPVPGVTEVLFASNSRSTRFIFTALEGLTRPSPENWHFSFERGDATVPAWSAAREPRLTTLQGSLQSFGEHSTIFDDDWVRNELKRELFSAVAILDRPIAGRGPTMLKVRVGGQDREWALEMLYIAPAETYIAANSTVEATVGLKFSTDARDFTSGVYKPRVSLQQGSVSVAMDVLETTTDTDRGNFTLTFKCRGETTDLEEGVLKFVVELPSAQPTSTATQFLVLLH